MPRKSDMPKMTEIFALEIGEPEVHPQQAHLDDNDLDPLGLGISQPKRHIQFGQNSMRRGVTKA